MQINDRLVQETEHYLQQYYLKSRASETGFGAQAFCHMVTKGPFTPGLIAIKIMINPLRFL